MWLTFGKGCFHAKFDNKIAHLCDIGCLHPKFKYEITRFCNIGLQNEMDKLKTDAKLLDSFYVRAKI